MKKERRIARAVALITAIITVFALTSCKVAGNNADEGSSRSDTYNEFVSESESYSRGSNIRDISSIDLGEVETIVDKSGEPYVTPNYNYRDRTVTFLSHWYPEDCLHLITYMDKYGGPQIK